MLSLTFFVYIASSLISVALDEVLLFICLLLDALSMSCSAIVDISSVT